MLLQREGAAPFAVSGSFVLLRNHTYVYNGHGLKILRERVIGKFILPAVIWLFSLSIENKSAFVLLQRTFSGSRNPPGIL